MEGFVEGHPSFQLPRGSSRTRRHGRRPAMGLRLALFRPCVQRVVDDEAVSQNFLVVRRDVAQPHRDREESGGLRREIMSVGVGAAYDRGDGPDRWVLSKGVFRDESVKTASVTHM